MADVRPRKQQFWSSNLHRAGKKSLGQWVIGQGQMIRYNLTGQIGHW